MINFGLEIISPNRASKGDGNTILTKPDMCCVKVMTGDGNCMFRALSFVLTGSQDQHLRVRSLICNHMHSIHLLVEPHISPNTNTRDYIERTRMEHNGTWGTDVELLTFANLCQTNVYVYNTERYTWIVYPPSYSMSNINVSTKSIILISSN